MKNRNVQFVTILVFFLLFSFWYSKGPVYTVDIIKEAAINQDVNTLNKHIDFEALKLSIKVMLVSQENSQSGKRGKYLSSLVSSVLLIPLVEKMVTPEAIVLLMSGYGPQTKYQDKEADNQSLNIETSWDGLSKASLQFKSRNGHKNNLLLVMEREGLHWKLIGIKTQNVTTQQQ